MSDGLWRGMRAGAGGRFMICEAGCQNALIYEMTMSCLSMTCGRASSCSL